jgi:hypothetical protein
MGKVEEGQEFISLLTHPESRTIYIGKPVDEV